jgi:hypothetical protein
MNSSENTYYREHFVGIYAGIVGKKGLENYIKNQL